MQNLGGRPLMQGPAGALGIGLPGQDQDMSARALFAAILAASRGECACQVCQLLRKVADSMASDLLKEAPGG